MGLSCFYYKWRQFGLRWTHSIRFWLEWLLCLSFGRPITIARDCKEISKLNAWKPYLSWLSMSVTQDLCFVSLAYEIQWVVTRANQIPAYIITLEVTTNVLYAQYQIFQDNSSIKFPWHKLQSIQYQQTCWLPGPVFLFQVITVYNPTGLSYLSCQDMHLVFSFVFDKQKYWSPQYNRMLLPVSQMSLN